MINNGFPITVFTLFPELFPGPLAASVVGKGLTKGLWSLETVNIRNYAQDKHRSVDDTPFGGGAGMVMRPDVIDKALSAHQSRAGVLLVTSPKGKPVDQAMIKKWARSDGMKILCGRYEGIDQRVIDQWQIEEISLGDFVLSGGELAAMAFIDAVVRLRPGILGAQESLQEESFENHLLEYPHYTRPAMWNGLEVPQVLQSGHHGEIARWRKAQSQAITKARRPDLWQQYHYQL